jgi:hypothetical protein
MDKEAVVDRVRDEKSEGSGFTSRGILEVKIQTMGLTKALRTDAGFEFNDLVIRTKFLPICPGGGDGVVIRLARDFVPDAVTEHIFQFFELSLDPLVSIVAGHGLGTIAGLDRGDREGGSGSGAAR